MRIGMVHLKGSHGDTKTQVGTAAGGGLDLKCAADSIDAFSHADEAQAGAARFMHEGRIETDTVILHLAEKEIVLGKELNGNGRGARVFYGVIQGLLKDAVQSDFRGGGQAAFEVRGDADRQAGAF